MKLVAAFLAISAVSASAQTQTFFTCKAMDENKPVKIQFVVENLEGKAELGALPGGEEYMPVKVTPSSSVYNDLNENWSMTVKNGKLDIDGDSDGFYLLNLVLYENQGYKKGYISVRGDEKRYSKVSCTTRTK